MANTERNFRMVIDTGSTMTVIPHFVRQKLRDPQDGWMMIAGQGSGYGKDARVTQVSRDWFICLGNRTN